MRAASDCASEIAAVDSSSAAASERKPGSVTPYAEITARAKSRAASWTMSCVEAPGPPTAIAGATSAPRSTPRVSTCAPGAVRRETRIVSGSAAPNGEVHPCSTKSSADSRWSSVASACRSAGSSRSSRTTIAGEIARAGPKLRSGVSKRSDAVLRLLRRKKRARSQEEEGRKTGCHEALCALFPHPILRIDGLPATVNGIRSGHAPR